MAREDFKKKEKKRRRKKMEPSWLFCHRRSGVSSLRYLFCQWNKPTQAAGIISRGPGVQP